MRLCKLLVIAGLLATLATLPAYAWSRPHHRGAAKARASDKDSGKGKKDKDSGKNKDKDKDKGKGKDKGSSNGNGSGSNSSGNGNGSGNGDSSGAYSTGTGSSGGSDPALTTSPPVPSSVEDAPDGLLVPTPPAFTAAVGAESVQGTVLVKTPGSLDFRQLDSASQLPNGTLVDAKAGAVRIVNPAALTPGEGAGGLGGLGHPHGASGPAGANRQSVVLSGAEFQILQPGAAIPTTELVLHGGDLSSCASGAHTRAARAARSKSIRRVRGSGHGRFRTRGRYGSATVRGTIWTTDDRCDGTLFSVQRGVVAVRDFLRNKTVQVAAGQSYFARAQR